MRQNDKGLGKEEALERELAEAELATICAGVGGSTGGNAATPNTPPISSGLSNSSGQSDGSGSSSLLGGTNGLLGGTDGLLGGTNGILGLGINILGLTL